MHNTRRLLLTLVAALLVWTPLSARQAASSQAQVPTPAPTTAASQEPDGAGTRAYRVGPGDALQINYIGLSSYDADMNRVSPVQSNGMIEVKYISSLSVAGHTTLWIQDELIRRLEEEQIFAKGTVRAIVQVSEYRRQSVIVSGAVRTPGVVELKGDQMDVNRAIAAAGGFVANAGQMVEVIRANPGDGPQIVTVTRDQLEQNDDPGLFEDDRVNVPIGEVFYVNGEVNNQGEKPWQPGMTVQQALALSAGTTPKFSLNRSKIQRPEYNAAGELIKYNDIKDLKPETTILPNDILVAGRKWM